jgi:hypothetical protein
MQRELNYPSCIIPKENVGRGLLVPKNRFIDVFSERFQSCIILATQRAAVGNTKQPLRNVGDHQLPQTASRPLPERVNGL